MRDASTGVHSVHKDLTWGGEAVSAGEDDLEGRGEFWRSRQSSQGFISTLQQPVRYLMFYAKSTVKGHITIIMDIYHAPSQESPGCLQYKLNTQMYAYTRARVRTHT